MKYIGNYTLEKIKIFQKLLTTNILGWKFNVNYVSSTLKYYRNLLKM